MTARTDAAWIFGYGSLMWRPGFAFAQRRSALLTGYHRAFCRISWRHRGTPERPGMVLGLLPGGTCRGVAFLPAPDRGAAVLAYLDEREGAGYRRVLLPLRLDGAPGPQPAQAWIYLPDADHPTYRADLPRERMVQLLATGVGESGAARDYLAELIGHLHALHAGDPALEELLRAVDAHRAKHGGNGAPDESAPDALNHVATAAGASADTP